MSEMLEKIVKNIGIDNIERFRIRDDNTLELVANGIINKVSYQSKKLLLSDIKALIELYKEEINKLNKGIKLSKALRDTSQEFSEQDLKSNRKDLLSKVWLLPIAVIITILTFDILGGLFVVISSVYALALGMNLKDYIALKKESKAILQIFDGYDDDKNNKVKQYSDVIGYLETLLVQQQQTQIPVSVKEKLYNLRSELNQFIDDTKEEKQMESGNQYMKH